MSVWGAGFALALQLALAVAFLKTWDWWDNREHRSWGHEALGVFAIGVGYGVASLLLVFLLAWIAFT